MRIETLDFGTLKIGDRIIIGEMKEGVDIKLAEAVKVIEVARENFKNSKWGYISNRVNEYSLQPTIHHETPKYEQNMVAYAVVAEKNCHIRNALLEKRIVADSYQYECFSDMGFAFEWVREAVEKAQRFQ